MSLTTSNDIRLNYKQLTEVLTTLGYTSVRTSEGHLVFNHAAHNSMLAITPLRSNAIVPKAVLASVIRNVINTNVATENRFKALTASV